MVVLKAIGRFFARIGRWIRDTAWVQPLLIVGAIFGLIFSIPYIVNGIKSASKEGDPADKYYSKTKLSWTGADKKTSEVQKLFSYIQDPDNPDNAAMKQKYGEKFFIAFVIEECPDCENNYYGLETLQKNWNKKNTEFVLPENAIAKDFKLATIYVDEKEKSGDKDLLFSKYISGNKSTCEYNEFFQDASTLHNPYRDNIDADENYYESVFSYENTFTTPTLMLIDMTGECDYAQSSGLSEILFKVEGREGGTGKTAKYDLARTLWDCWNHQGKFSKDYVAR